MNSSNYADLALDYIYLNRLGEAEATIKEALSNNLDSPKLHIRLYHSPSCGTIRLECCVRCPGVQVNREPKMFCWPSKPRRRRMVGGSPRRANCLVAQSLLRRMPGKRRSQRRTRSLHGHAYLIAGDGFKWAAEFQKILDHPGVALNRPIGALAHLDLARAYRLQGDTARARAAYQDFLTLWKDADPGIPVMQQATAEYNNLK